MKFCLAVVTIILIGLSSAAHAQSNEFAAEASGLFNPSAISPSAGLGLQLNYAHRLAHVPLVSLYGEIPFVAGFSNSQFVVTQLARLDYNSYYVTPGLKVKFAPGFFLSPYLAAGVGWAHFSSNNTSNSSDQFAADWGGGLDMKVFPFVSLRLEARDFYSGVPSLVPFTSQLGNQNNVVVSGGIVLRF